MPSKTQYRIIREPTIEGLELEEAKEQWEFRSTYSWRSVHLAPWVIYLLIAVSSASLSSIITRNISLLWQDGFLLVPAGDIVETWHYNRTFSDPPSLKTEEAWRSIFPRGRGFFSHPTLDVNISGIAVFHELHCLNGIYRAYYATLNQSEHNDFTNMDDPDAKVDAANAHNDPHHVRHCFDYLRRALMCAADTNLERIDWHVGGSTGWGFERKCRDYSAVVKWAEKWRYHSQTQIT